MEKNLKMPLISLARTSLIILVPPVPFKRVRFPIPYEWPDGDTGWVSRFPSCSGSSELLWLDE